MRKFHPLLAAAILLPAMFAPLAHASDPTPMPQACPSVAAIQQAGFDSLSNYEEYGFYNIHRGSQYDTNTSWLFGMMLTTDEANSAQDAVNKAKDAMKTLSGTPMPVQRKLNIAGIENFWVCEYANADGYYAAAITPPPPVAGSTLLSIRNARK